MKNWLFAPLDPSRLTESSHIAQIIIASCLRNESCKNKLAFALLIAASSNIYFHDMVFLTVFILILCVVQKKSSKGEKGKRFLLFEIQHSLLVSFRVPSSVCVGFHLFLPIISSP